MKKYIKIILIVLCISLIAASFVCISNGAIGLNSISNPDLYKESRKCR
ncbi:MAG: hypothetical protein HFJ51_05115 [Clostridia bacterium]|nr:hypothetical protein [Clostridia bacterium]